MMANEGSIQSMGDNQYKVTLSQVDPGVIRFTNGPLRDASRMDISTFVDFSLAHVDPSVQPSVAVQGYTLDKGKLIEHNYVLALQKPEYDSKSQTLTYQGRLLGDQKAPMLAKLNDLTLFIDDSSLKTVG